MQNESSDSKQTYCHGISLDLLNKACETSKLRECQQRIDFLTLESMTASAMQATAVFLHTPLKSVAAAKDNGEEYIHAQLVLDMMTETTLGLLDYLYDQWDRSGLTEEFVKFAPLTLSLNKYAHAQVRALEQEILSPLAMPAEIWVRIWKDYDKKLKLFGDLLRRDGPQFRFSQLLPKLRTDLAKNGLEDIEPIQVAGGYRLTGVGARLSAWSPTGRITQEGDQAQRGAPPPALPYIPALPIFGPPVVFHFSPVNWGKRLLAATSALVGALNGLSAIPSGGWTIASIAAAVVIAGAAA